MIRFLSLFSGIEAASVAWEPLGWRCVGVAEVETFACAVLAHRFPGLPNLGDVTTITDEQIARLGPLVPGALTSNGGRDFAVVVGALAGCAYDVPVDGWKSAGVALGPRGLVEWCVLDAQYAGLAQRRERVFALLDSGNWRGRGSVLLESHRVCGNPPARGTARTSAPRGPRRGSEGGDVDRPVVPWPLEVADPVCANEQRTYTHEGEGNFRLRNVVASEPIAFDTTQITHPENRSRAEPGAPCPTLAKNGHARVRRLTPRECERLQGFPDDWTLILYGGRPAKDAPRYRVLGNTMPVPVMRWIGARIAQAHEVST